MTEKLLKTALNTIKTNKFNQLMVQIQKYVFNISQSKYVPLNYMEQKFIYVK